MVGLASGASPAAGEGDGVGSDGMTRRDEVVFIVRMEGVLVGGESLRLGWTVVVVGGALGFVGGVWSGLGG